MGRNHRGVSSLLAASGAAVFVYFQFEEMAKQTGILIASFEKQKQDSVESSQNTAKQLSILEGQLTEQQKSTQAVTSQMRQDQRPWLRVEFAPTAGASNDPTRPQASLRLATGQPIHGITIRIRNSGKTPAEVVTADFVIQIATINNAMRFPPEPGLRRRLHRGDRPPDQAVGDSLADPNVLINHIETGVIFPDSFAERELVRQRMDQQRLVDIPLSFDEGLAMLNGALMYVTGRVEYIDEFGTHHWTDFCRALSDAPENSRCAKYNAVDSNQ